MIEITHTAEEGTLADGTERGDGSGPILKRHGFRWSRNLGMWFARNSRYRAANTFKLDQAVAELRGAGFDVEVSIDATPVAPEAREDARSERAQERHAGLSEKAERHGQRAAQAHERAHRATEQIPFGQPILVGHHSERRHRAAIERSDRAMGRAVSESAESREAQRRAKAALAADRHRQTPTYIGRRIRDAEAEERRLVRVLEELAIAGPRRDTLTAELTQVRLDLDYWRQRLATLEAEGVKVWGPDDFAKRDRVQYRGHAGTVQRVNPKTLTVAPDVMPQCPQRVPYTDVQAKIEP